MNSNFSFIKDSILRSNIDHTFDQILVITSLINNESYNEVIKSNFRKIAIILTASIIEALLLYLLKKHKTEKEIQPINQEIKIIKLFYKINEKESISHIVKKQKSTDLKFSKLNLGQLISICKDHEIIHITLKTKLEKIQKLRNKQHIGTLELIDTEYSQNELKLAFNVAKEVKELAQCE
jgi:hypothetical protein